MSLFDLLIVQPIFNLLVVIYGLLPGSDFGVAIILFTILVRLLMWPLVKKQLHQTRVMRDIQPELKKIKAKSKGNQQLQAQLMMELYREKGVSPFSSIGLLLIQLPIFIALYRVINIVTQQRDQIANFTYDPLESLSPVAHLITNPQGFSETLLGVVNLAERVITSSGGVYIPALLLAVIAASLQYVQAKQTAPQPEEGKRLRDVLKQQATGKEVDQAEMSALVSSRMIIVFPFITLIVALYLPAALVLYFAVSSLVAVIQQHMILSADIEEMEDYAEEVMPAKTTQKPQKSAQTIKEAEIVAGPAENNAKKSSAKAVRTKKRKKR